MSHPHFSVSEEDWSLHRKGYEDQRRHQEKVKEAIRKNLPDLVSEESIIMSDGQQIIKIPIRSMEEYRFRYNFNKGKHVGQGNGDSKVGDVLGKEQESGQAGPGKGQGAGDQAGMDYYEAEISIAELEGMLFAEMELPHLERKEQLEITTEDIRFNDIRKKGLMGNIDKRRTLLSAIKRNALKGHKKIRISDDDLRFKTWEDVVVPHSNAVVIAMMDTSGSMGIFEKYIARSFFFWMVRFLRTKYENVEIVFIAHHTEAKVVSEEAFFTKGESGGTICSSAYRKALEVIDAHYPPDQYNIYPFHFSDGDNLSSDNERCVGLVKEILKRANIFGYGEVNQYNRNSTLMSAYRHLKEDRFSYFVIKEKAQVYEALKHFFGKKEA
ncbi:sporulation protein YhbH [Laceyella putida]|uniref:Sporulation protein YhbH n=1 Tax=Laceyella putida TaxID=110101 RepID=A0ABW2RH70_9BACL